MNAKVAVQLFGESLIGWVCVVNWKGYQIVGRVVEIRPEEELVAIIDGFDGDEYPIREGANLTRFADLDEREQGRIEARL